MTEVRTICEIMNLRAMEGLSMSPLDCQFLGNSLAHGTVKVLKDPLERPVGYVVWADVNTESADRVLKRYKMPMFPYEWREGNIFLILDVVFKKGYFREAIVDLISLINQQESVVFVKRSRSRLYRKIDGRFRRII